MSGGAAEDHRSNLDASRIGEIQVGFFERLFDLEL